MSELCLWRYKLSDLTSIESEEADFSNSIIYPNPATDFITITLSNNELQLLASGVKVQIFDMLGIEVMSESIHPMTRSHRMNVTHYINLRIKNCSITFTLL